MNRMLFITFLACVFLCVSAQPSREPVQDDRDFLRNVFIVV